jgi:DNA-binding SARP family transcriptional activator
MTAKGRLIVLDTHLRSVMTTECDEEDAEGGGSLSSATAGAQVDGPAAEPAQAGGASAEIARMLYGCVDYLAQAAEQISLALDSVRAAGVPGVPAGLADETLARPVLLDRLRVLPLSSRSRRAQRPEPQARAGAQPESPEPAARVAFRTLGAFCVEVDGRPVAASRWRSKKSRDLIKLLLSRPGRPIPREEVMDVLWPQEPAQALGSRLSVVLSTTRAVLAGEDRCTGPSPLTADRDVVSLDLRLAESDVARFLRDADRALAADRQGRDSLDELITAERRYQGDFLECEPYADWAMPLREHARAKYINVLHSLVRQSERAGQPVLAIDYALRLLEYDAYDEQAHLWLIRLLRMCGRHGEARRIHANYVARMREIGVEPAAAAS